MADASDAPKGAAAALAAAGYKYVKLGEREADYGLRQVADETKKFEWAGQEKYDALGNAVTEHLYNEMVQTYKLRKDQLGDGEKPCYVFHRDLDAPTVCVLIQGSGAVTPGMWARSLCINESLHEGTIFPYLRAAADRGWGVLVASPNAEAPGHECAERHTQRLLARYIEPSPAKQVVIVAHSYGGWSTLHYLKTADAAQTARIACVAMTDSVHKLQMTAPSADDVANAKDPEKMKQKVEAREALREMVPAAFDAPSAEVLDFLRTKCVNWVRSDRPVGEAISECVEGVPTRSAGHDDHVWTSGTAFPDVFKYIDSMLPQRPNTIRETLDTAIACKAEGNEKLKQGKFKEASLAYKKGNVYLKSVLPSMLSKGDDEAGEGGQNDMFSSMAEKYTAKQGKAIKPTLREIDEARSLSIAINNNLAQARLKLEDWKGTVRYADVVLIKDPFNMKAQLRRGTAYMNMGRLDEAKADFEEVQKQDPDSVTASLKKLKEAYTTLQAKEKKRYSNMFQ